MRWKHRNSTCIEVASPTGLVWAAIAYVAPSRIEFTVEAAR